MSDSDDYSSTLQIFKERSIVQVKDYDLELSSRIHKTHERFTKELQIHYADILRVTNGVDRLNQDLKDGDSLFMDLCFKDDFFRLIKLPEFKIEAARTNHTTISGPVPNESSSQLVLTVSKWVLAISDLISRFESSSSSSKLFDKVMQEFEELAKNITGMSTYQDVIKTQCDDFLKYISSSNPHAFTLQQWIRIYNLVLRDGKNLFPWETNMLIQLEGLVFDSVFEEDIDVLLKSKDTLVSQFVSTESFQKKLNERLLNDINTQFTRLEELRVSDSTDSPILDFPKTPVPVSSLDIEGIIEDSQLYSLGLATDSKVRWYKIITPLVESIDKLEQYGGSSNAQIPREQLVAKLREKIPSASKAIDGNHSTMDDVMSEIMNNFNEEKFSRMIESKIQALVKN